MNDQVFIVLDIDAILVAIPDYYINYSSGKRLDLALLEENQLRRAWFGLRSSRVCRYCFPSGVLRERID